MQAAAITSTLADPRSVLPAWQAPRRAGPPTIAPNSGVEFTSEAGSRSQIAPDGRSAGEMASERFNRAAVGGTLLCVIDEQDNSGLDQRCDGLEAA